MRRGMIALLVGLVAVGMLAAGCSSFGWRQFAWKGSRGAGFSLTMEYPDYFAPQQTGHATKGHIVLLGVATQMGFASMPGMFSAQWLELAPKETLREAADKFGRGKIPWKPTRVGGASGYQASQSNGLIAMVQPKGCRSVCLIRVLYGTPKKDRVVRDCKRMFQSVRLEKI